MDDSLERAVVVEQQYIEFLSFFLSAAICAAGIASPTALTEGEVRSSDTSQQPLTIQMPVEKRPYMSDAYLCKVVFVHPPAPQSMGVPDFSKTVYPIGLCYMDVKMYVNY